MLLMYVFYIFGRKERTFARGTHEIKDARSAFFKGLIILEKQSYGPTTIETASHRLSKGKM
jgi:hypothetical protein